MNWVRIEFSEMPFEDDIDLSHFIGVEVSRSLLTIIMKSPAERTYRFGKLINFKPKKKQSFFF